MLFAVSEVADVVGLVIAAVAGALIVGIATAALHVVQRHSKQGQNNAEDVHTVTDYFFDQPEDPRTRTPAKKGWTTQVDEKFEAVNAQLRTHSQQLGHMGRTMDRVLAEVLPDGNGDHNLRGEVKKSRAAAETVVKKLETESDGTDPLT